MKHPMVIDGTFITVPVSEGVQAAWVTWCTEHFEDLRVMLEPFGLHPDDIALPELHRIVWEDE